jgi:hypothetical protein
MGPSAVENEEEADSERVPRNSNIVSLSNGRLVIPDYFGAAIKSM